jgi:flagellar biosynthesis/type III secretory pathway M-ring protein FliF/YscJ
MSDPMKSGAGTNPFKDDDEDEDDADSQENDQSSPETESTDPFEDARETSRPVETGGDKEETLPYIFERDSVKADRSMIQYFLREEAASLEDDIQQAVEEEIGTDVYLTDVREAIIHVAAEHPDEIAEVLREWGYRFKE